MRQKNMYGLPLGFHFEPTEEELITFYLRKKVMGQSPPWEGVKEKNIYGEKATPWNIFKDEEDLLWETSVTKDTSKNQIKMKKTTYVFGKLRKIGKIQIYRKAGCGTWDGQTKAEKVKNEKGEIIGFKKMFVFELEKGLKVNTYGHWIMHEYRLDGVSLIGLGDTTNIANDYVICKISRTYSEDLNKAPAIQRNFEQEINGVGHIEQKPLEYPRESRELKEAGPSNQRNSEQEINVVGDIEQKLIEYPRESRESNEAGPVIQRNVEHELKEGPALISQTNMELEGYGFWNELAELEAREVFRNIDSGVYGACNGFINHGQILKNLNEIQMLGKRKSTWMEENPPGPKNLKLSGGKY